MTDAPFRADHVGSLLRPKSLLALRERDEAGVAGAGELRAAEDAAIEAAVAMQHAIGLEGITDGEFRRGSFHGDFIGRLNGVEFGLSDPAETAGKAKAPFVAVVSDRLSLPAGGIETESFRFLSRLTDRTAKQSIPSPTMLHFRGGREAIDRRAYPEIGDFFADVARVFREEIACLAGAGCRYLQLDDTNLAYLCDDGMRAQAEGRGENLATLPRDYARLINESIRDRPASMAVCVHLCRGNAMSRWFAEGGYEPVADVVFNEIDVDGFFLEFDDERSGDFTPLRFVPAGTKVVLGLITSKTGRLEDPDAVKRRIDEAARFVPLEQLCLSPQCGFASAAGGNLLTEDEQRRKLALVVEVADDVWG